MSDRAQAEESVATRFSRVMNATTSPLGVLTDPPIVALLTAFFVLSCLGARELGAGPVSIALGALAFVPTLVAVGASVALAGARRKVVAWLASLPFPVDNMNAVLNGLGDVIEVTFAGSRPASAELNSALDAIHPDAFVTRNEADEPSVDVRLGVVDSKRNPAGSNHRRYVRLEQIVERVLVPLAKDHPIASVRVK